MSGTKILLDTDIVIKLLAGDSNLGSLLEGVEAYLSFVSELELLGCKATTRGDQEWIEKLLSECHIVDLNSSIKEVTRYNQWEYDLKLPDAIIAATSLCLGIPLLSSSPEFEKVRELIFIQYLH